MASVTARKKPTKAQTKARRVRRVKPAPPPTFDDFRHLLKAWSAEDSSSPAVGDAVSAAQRACYEAAITYATKKGTILVSCADVAGARAVMDILKAYFIDQRELNRLLKKIGTDTIELHGPTILVSASQRRPKDLLCTIRLVSPIEAEVPSSTNLARTLLYLAARYPGHPSVAKAESMLALPPGALKGLLDRILRSGKIGARR